MTIRTGRADWRAVGRCKHADPDLFFPISSAGHALEQIAEAKAICVMCPVRQQCLEFAQKNAVTHGIWGGMAPEEREQARQRQRRLDRVAGQPDPSPLTRTPNSLPGG